MRSSLLLAASLLLGLSGAAFAQAGGTQSPPSPNSGSSAPEPANSLPSGSSGTAGPQGTEDPAALPSGSTGNKPSGAFDRTVPKPTDSSTSAPR